MDRIHRCHYFIIKRPDSAPKGGYERARGQKLNGDSKEVGLPKEQQIEYGIDTRNLYGRQCSFLAVLVIVPFRLVHHGDISPSYKQLARSSQV